MKNVSALLTRCGSQCELCNAKEELQVFEVPDSANQSQTEIMLCDTCLSQLAVESDLDTHHWRVLNDTMWSAVPAVQVMAWRQLKRLESEPWAQEALDILYLDEELQAWAQAGVALIDEDEMPTKDCNGVILVAGDTVTVIKDLNVKGTSFTAKRGTAVRNITLTSNPEHIEGRINGTKIVLLTCFLKKV